MNLETYQTRWIATHPIQGKDIIEGDKWAMDHPWRSLAGLLWFHCSWCWHRPTSPWRPMCRRCRSRTES